PLRLTTRPRINHQIFNYWNNSHDHLAWTCPLPHSHLSPATTLRRPGPPAPPRDLGRTGPRSGRSPGAHPSPGDMPMHLMRIGPAGSEKPVVRIDDDSYVDVSDI